MTNNDIFKKLRVALMLRDDEIVDILKQVDFNISKSELGAFFRKEDHPNYRECGDQVLRNFLNGLVIYLRGTKEEPKFPGDVLKKAGSTHQEKPRKNFKAQQHKSINRDITNVKYKNKPNQRKGEKKS
ncbi:DUF1456 family protein [Pseudozobellia thermophila]|uniref:Uncharacterized protein n=1 Tax=Pseudozobellia thermophila TaxID=192903 RepID=A0A1M6HVC1_9FLAO|nr:DUF1456 family protein [Pseudozobellia thermophila]SHJ26202.1 Protein of unknown function [Pseudozobellia thermophila]